MADERCDLTELPVSMCAHCQHHELPQPHAGPGPAFAAAYPGRCSQCDDGIEPADLIRADGEGGYVHAGCIR